MDGEKYKKFDRKVLGSDKPMQGPPNLDQILDTIRAEGFKVTVPPEHHVFPETISFRGFEGLDVNGKKALESVANFCRQYLSAYIIVDDYGSDRPARRARWNEIEKKYGREFEDIHEHDKLRLGSVINAPLGFFEWLVINLDRANIHTPQAEEVRSLQKEFSSLVDTGRYDSEHEELPYTGDYDKLSFEEKVAMSRKIDNIAERFLSLVTREKAR